MPRYILSQFNTHRMFSRSAQSSRAVPAAKLIKSVSDSGFIPDFMKNKAGMQADELFAAYEQDGFARHWINAKDAAVSAARVLSAGNVHKQFVNRLIEPFSTVKVVVTATEWDNFFKLRLHHAAQPEFQQLAQAMRDAMDASRPDILEVDEWHLPYINSGDCFSREQLKKIPLVSAARCARVSYLNHDNSNPDIEKDLELARQLLADGHLSPFEHQAKPISDSDELLLSWSDVKGITHQTGNSELWSANFREWLQFRQLIGDANNG